MGFGCFSYFLHPHGCKSVVALLIFFAPQVTKLDKMDRSINLIYLDSKQGLFRTSLSLASNRLLFNLKTPFQPPKKQLADIAKLGALVAKEQLAGSH